MSTAGLPIKGYCTVDGRKYRTTRARSGHIIAVAVFVASSARGRGVMYWRPVRRGGKTWDRVSAAADASSLPPFRPT